MKYERGTWIGSKEYQEFHGSEKEKEIVLVNFEGERVTKAKTKEMGRDWVLCNAISRRR